MTASTDSAFMQGQAALEELVDQKVVSHRLARSKFLRWLGTGVFGAAMSVTLPATKAYASTCGTTLSPCYGYRLCPYGCTGCCRNDISFCDPHCNGGYLGCPSGSTCWYTCYGGRRHKCCDCRSGSVGNCICHFIVGTC